MQYQAQHSIKWALDWVSTDSVLATFGQNIKLSDCLQISSSSTQYLPWGAAALVLLDASKCQQLNALGWLASDAGRTLSRLDISDTNVRQVPAYLRSLRDLDISGCCNLQADWLHPSSGLHLKTLVARRSCVPTVPDCVPSLTCIHVASCSELADDWLPASVGAHVDSLDVSASSQRCRPAGLKDGALFTSHDSAGQ